MKLGTEMWMAFYVDVSTLNFKKSRGFGREEQLAKVYESDSSIYDRRN